MIGWVKERWRGTSKLSSGDTEICLSDRQAAAEPHEADEEARRRERDGEPENDPQGLPDAAAAFGEGDPEAKADDREHADRLSDRSGQRRQQAAERALPRHAGAGGQGIAADQEEKGDERQAGRHASQHRVILSMEEVAGLRMVFAIVRSSLPPRPERGRLFALLRGVLTEIAELNRGRARASRKEVEEQVPALVSVLESDADSRPER